MGLKLQTLALTRIPVPAPMVFDRVNTMTTEALNTFKGVAGFIAVLIIGISLAKSEGLARVLTVALTAAIGLWLVAFGGMEQLAELAGQTIEG